MVELNCFASLVPAGKYLNLLELNLFSEWTWGNWEQIEGQQTMFSVKKMKGIQHSVWMHLKQHVFDLDFHKFCYIFLNVSNEGVGGNKIKTKNNSHLHFSCKIISG